MQKLSIGGENFADLIRNDGYYVDKTGFNPAVMESPSKGLLITRPRRFGKTLFMDKLKNFLQLDWENPKATTRHQAIFAGYQCPTCFVFGIAFSKKLCVVKVEKLAVDV